jgi:hypothetical protein
MVRHAALVGHGQWNYTIDPTGGQVAPLDDQERTRVRAAASAAAAVLNRQARYPGFHPRG